MNPIPDRLQQSYELYYHNHKNLVKTQDSLKALKKDLISEVCKVTACALATIATFVAGVIYRKNNPFKGIWLIIPHPVALACLTVLFLGALYIIDNYREIENLKICIKNEEAVISVNQTCMSLASYAIENLG